SWDTIRARVHWSVSTARQAALRRRGPAYGWLAAGTAVGAAIRVATGMWSRTAGGLPPAPPPPLAHAPPEAPAPSPPSLARPVTRAAGDVMLDGLRPADLFARRLAEGSSLATGDGRVDIQFGADSAFALGPMSTIRLRRFDARGIELVVDGTVDIAVAPRADG